MWARVSRRTAATFLHLTSLLLGILDDETRQTDESSNRIHTMQSKCSKKEVEIMERTSHTTPPCRGFSVLISDEIKHGLCSHRSWIWTKSDLFSTHMCEPIKFDIRHNCTLSHLVSGMMLNLVNTNKYIISKNASYKKKFYHLKLHTSQICNNKTEL